MNNTNEMELIFEAKAQNEEFAKVAVGAFFAPDNQKDLRVEDVKTAVAAAVNNSVTHGYPTQDGKIYIRCTVKENVWEVSVSDTGAGTEEVKKAGGISLMESCMDQVEVQSMPGFGTSVKMQKNIKK